MKWTVMSGRSLVFLFAVALAGPGSSGCSAEGKPVTPVNEWSGAFPMKEDEALLKEYPPDGFIASEKAWGKLCKAWRGNEDPPKVDFDKQFIVVAYAMGGRNKIQARFELTDAGDLKGLISATELGGPGFAYLILVMDRTGVKTYNGKAIGKE